MLGVFGASNHISCFKYNRVFSSFLIIGPAINYDQDLYRCMFVPVQGRIGPEGCFCDVVAQFGIVMYDSV